MNHKTITLPIHGMTCISCVAHVEGALSDIPGVIEVDVNLRANTASIRFIDSLTTIQNFKDAVAKIGYTIP